MVFNAPFNNISVSFIDGENWSTRRKPLTCRKSLTNFRWFLFISFSFRWFRFVSFRFCWFRFVSFRFRWFRFDSFLFRFALYRCPTPVALLLYRLHLRKNVYRKCNFSDKIKICRKIIFVKRTLELS
jgi:hypothetical protein